MENLDLTITKEKQTPTEGRFVLGPLPSGYGVTLGTSLRRVLLASLPGGAITEVRIAGVSHPFTALKGVKEDVVEILLNVEIVVKLLILLMALLLINVNIPTIRFKVIRHIVPQIRLLTL